MMCPCSRRTIVAALAGAAATAAHAQWTADPSANTPIAVVSGNQTVPKIAAGPIGDAWVTWFDNRGGGYAVYAQHLDPAGVPLLGSNGLLISGNPQSTSLVDWDLIVDSSGNAVIVFTDTRAGGDLDVYAYRIAPDGTFLWGPNGVALSDNNNFEASPSAVETTGGLFAFVWTRSSAAGGSPPGLVMQVLNGAGTPQIAGDGLVIAGNPEVPGFQELLPMSNGDIFVSYVRDTRTFTSPRHVRAARYAPDGTLVWGPALVSGTVSVPIAHRPRLAPAGGDAAVIAWNGASSNVWAARVNADGTMPWTAGGVALATEAGFLRFDPAVACDQATGDTYATFNKRDAGQGTRGQNAQRLDSAGNLQWGAAGVELSPFDSVVEGPARAWPFAGGAIFAFTDTPFSGVNRWLAFRVKSDGSFAWPTNPLVVSSPNGVKFRNPLGVVSATGVGMLCWEDQRDDPSSDLYAQNINPDGTLGNHVPACPGDADGDNMVGLSDIAAIIQNWFLTGFVGYFGDLTSDGLRGVPDIAEVINHWGESCGI